MAGKVCAECGGKLRGRFYAQAYDGGPRVRVCSDRCAYYHAKGMDCGDTSQRQECANERQQMAAVWGD